VATVVKSNKCLNQLKVLSVNYFISKHVNVMMKLLKKHQKFF
jgi:hypothetical protein